MMMRWHRLELILGPASHGMNMAGLVAHEIELADIDGNRLAADAEKTSDIDYDLLVAVHVRHGADLLVTRSVDRCPCQSLFVDFAEVQARMICVIHGLSPLS